MVRLQNSSLLHDWVNFIEPDKACNVIDTICLSKPQNTSVWTNWNWYKKSVLWQAQQLRTLYSLEGLFKTRFSIKNQVPASARLASSADRSTSTTQLFMMFKEWRWWGLNRQTSYDALVLWARNRETSLNIVLVNWRMPNWQPLSTRI